MGANDSVGDWVGNAVGLMGCGVDPTYGAGVGSGVVGVGISVGGNTWLPLGDALGGTTGL